MRLATVLAAALLPAALAACAPRAVAPASAAPAVAAPAPARAAEAAAPATAASQATVAIPVSGMHCGHCAQRVDAALLAVEGVASADTSLEGRRTVVVYDPARVTVARLADAIREAGYTPGEPAKP